MQEQHTAYHLGSGSVQVLATPMMIAFMENTSLNLLDRYLEEGESSVGMHVDVRHLAPSGLGANIEVKVSITAVDGRKVTLEVQAWDGEILVGTGIHTRYVINVEDFQNQVKKADDGNADP